MKTDLALAGFAGFRAARAVAIDSITEPIRTRVDHAASQPGRFQPVQEKLAELISCPHCVGFWLTATAWVALRSDSGLLKFVVGA